MVTVADIRDYATGPSPKSAPHAFAEAAPTDQAAWCWVRDLDRQLNIAYAAHAGDKPIRMVAEARTGFRQDLRTGIPHFP
jgi:hypothetical protein